MHDPVIQNLEAYLEGRHAPELESHVRSCESCRTDLEAMVEHAACFHSLKVEEELAPSPGFYNRVAARIESQAQPSFWDLLLDPIFGRRLVLAIATMVMVISGYLMLTPTEAAQISYAPERLLVSPPPNAPTQVGQDVENDRNVVLVDMVSYAQAD